MSRTYYHRHFRKDWKAPRSWRTIHYTRPERQAVRNTLRMMEALKVENLDTSRRIRPKDNGWY